MRRGTGQPSGFTLIELMIVVVVIAVLAAAATPMLRSVTGANARASAGELAGAARYLFDTAALRHQTCRLVLDLDESAWWAECTKEKFLTSARPQDARDEEEQALADRFPDERDAEKRRLLASPRFEQFSDRLAKRRELPGGARFSEVWAQHQREPLSKGKAMVYFYGHGQAEQARIPIVDGDNVYSVVTQAFTGRARVVAGKPEVPRS